MTSLVIGFDLDMTLIDSRPGISAVLRRVSAEFEVPLPVDEIASALGPPLTTSLGPHLPPEQLPAVVARFRELYPDLAVAGSPMLPGAREAIAAARALGARVAIVTGKFAANAELHRIHLGLDVDEVVGNVWGPEKGPALEALGATLYVGDHVHDVAGARAAGITSVSVTTGPCSRAELLAAGTDVVLDSLAAFPQWLREHVEAPVPGRSRGRS